LIDSSIDEFSETTIVIKKFRHFYIILRNIDLFKYLKTIETKTKINQNLIRINLLKKYILFIFLYIGKSYETINLLNKVYGILEFFRGFGIILQLKIKYN
jgi:hypothetical protein